MHAILFIVLLQPMSEWNEPQWSAHICKQKFGLEPVNGKTVEVRTPDGSRVDILTKEYAVEVDWCKSGKWAEAIGQSLFYAAATNRKPAIILLMKNPVKERRYYLRALVVCNKYNIKLTVYRVP